MRPRTNPRRTSSATGTHRLPRIAAPAARALANAGYHDLAALTRVSESDVAGLHGMGPKALGLLREALKAQGLGFAASPGGPKVRENPATPHHPQR